MSTLTSPLAAGRPRARSSRSHDLVALTGAVFVLGVIGALVAGGNTPDGDANAGSVITHYTANRTQGIVASVILALTAIPALAFAARLHERARVAIGPDRTLPNLAFGAGVLAAAGVLGAAAIHLALSDYARDLDPTAAQALNALDADSFLLFTTGMATFVLAASLTAIRGRLMPSWLGWIGIPTAVAMFTPVGFFAGCIAAVWLIATSLILFASGQRPAEGASQLSEADRASDGRASDRMLAPTLGS